MQSQSIRREMIALLEAREMDALAISGMLKIREKDVYAHLEHIQRTLKSRNRRLAVTPFTCRVCGFVFESRNRLKKPGRCPKCKQGSFDAATYRVI
jgi:transcriptional regulator